MDKYDSLKLNPHMIVAVAVHAEVVSIVSGDSLQEVVIGLGRGCPHRLTATP